MPARPADALALIQTAYARLDAWEGDFGPVQPHAAMAADAERLGAALDEFLGRLTAPPRGETPGMYPFFHPRFAGQMLKPPHPVALAAYAAAARINPNNHALDGGPPTAAMEKEAVGWLAEMLGFPGDSLGHLTGGGTVANLEALFVAREETGGKAVAVARDAHYTHARMNGVLGVETVRGRGGRRRPDAPRRARGRARSRPRRDGRSHGGDDRARNGRSHRRSDPAVPRSRRPRPHRRRLRWVLSPAGSQAMRRKGFRLPTSWRLRAPTRSWSTRTSTGFSRTGAAVSSSATRPSGGTTGTTRPTPTSRPRHCTSARSASSARAPAPPPRRCG